MENTDFFCRILSEGPDSSMIRVEIRLYGQQDGYGESLEYSVFVPNSDSRKDIEAAAIAKLANFIKLYQQDQTWSPTAQLPLESQSL